MILAITLNPLLERRYIFPQTFLGKENRNGKTKLTAGGKGINVSRQLNYLNIENISFTFLGGTNGKLLKEILSEEKINFTSIRIKNETRDAALILDESDQTLTTYFSFGAEIYGNEVSEFKIKLKKMIQNVEIVVFSGSSGCKATNSIFPYGIEIAKRYNKISVCDTYGTHLKDCIKAQPTILHNNISETEKSLDISLKTEEEILDYLNYLYQAGIKQSFITNGEKNTYASNFNYKYKVENPAIDYIDSTGSGDSFTAGLIYCLRKNLTFEETLKTASALGAANAAKPETCNVSFEELELIKPLLKISTIGKKIKKLDVTPH